MFYQPPAFSVNVERVFQRACKRTNFAIPCRLVLFFKSLKALQIEIRSRDTTSSLPHGNSLVLTPGENCFVARQCPVQAQMRSVCSNTRSSGDVISEFKNFLTRLSWYGYLKQRYSFKISQMPVSTSVSNCRF